MVMKRNLKGINQQVREACIDITLCNKQGREVWIIMFYIFSLACIDKIISSI
jgi:hypothetical protein